MRPRPDAAENLVQAHTGVDVGLASMRPRPDAAENPGAPAAAHAGAGRFNEAAARCRGKRERARVQAAGRRALQ